jgi:ABC-type transport system involved in multi-copper enzyme maturation permease subunit
MARPHHDDPADDHIAPVGPFTGFGNFFRKEVADWWNSLRLLIVFAIMTLIMASLVFFVFNRMLEQEQFARMNQEAPPKAVVGARLLLVLLSPEGPGLILYIFIIIFCTMGLLTTEKASGTLAWNLTKPLGRTGLFVAKWLAATLMLWLGMVVAPILAATLCMIAYAGVTPDFAKMNPVILASLAWIGLWVLISLTVSLGFQSQGAVAGILIAFWAVPNILGFLLGEALGKESAEWVIDRLATNSPFWAYEIAADRDLHFRHRVPDVKTIWYWAFAGWAVVLSVFSLRVFQRQEVGS